MTNYSGDDRRFQGPEGEWFDGGQGAERDQDHVDEASPYEHAMGGSAHGDDNVYPSNTGHSQQPWVQPTFVDAPPPWGMPEQSLIPSKTPRGRGKMVAVVATIAALGILVAGGVVWLVGQSRGPNLEVIADKCDNSVELGVLASATGARETMEALVDAEDAPWEMVPSFVTVSSDQESLVVDDREFISLDKVDFLSGMRGATRDSMEEFVDQWNGIRDLSILSAVGCIHDELDLPDSVGNRMGSTRALDGVQEVSHNGIRITWNYHPSKGLDVIYEKE